MSDTCIGLDIGGANIKYASIDGEHGSLPFELWNRPNELADFLDSQLPRLRDASAIGVTMTGELADCFASKAEGVRHICRAVDSVANGEVRFYQTSGEFVSMVVAIKSWQLTAASNWHALAAWVGQVVPDGWLLDIGSTTTDLIPIKNSKPANESADDLGRLCSGELIYTGVIRSPVCAVVDSVEIENQKIPVAQELFSNMLDVYLVTGDLQESESCRHTADGRPADLANAWQRLARMLCADVDELGLNALRLIAQQIARRQQELLSDKLKLMIGPSQSPQTFVVVGEGEFLGQRVCERLGRQHCILSSHDIVQKFRPGTQLNSIETASAIAHLYKRDLNVKDLAV